MKADILENVVHKPRSRLEDLQEKNCKNGQKYMDAQFPANLNSLVGHPKPAEYRNEWDIFQWRRPDQIWPAGSYDLIQEISPDCIKQGYLSNRYFVGALSMLAERPALLTRLLSHKKINPAGVYGVYLFHNGAWKETVVDDLFPVYPDSLGNAQYAFSHSRNNDFWIQLFEKAYSKAYGSYYAISGGTLSLALNDLTGSVCESQRVDSQRVEREGLWREIGGWVRSDYLRAFSLRPNTLLEGPNSLGLLPGLPYSIETIEEIQMSSNANTPPVKMVKLKNPWSEVYIDKIWGDHRSYWKEEIRQKYGEVVDKNGGFWVPYELALQHFEEVTVCKTAPRQYFDAIDLCPIQDKSVFHLLLESDSTVDFSFYQEDVRFLRSKAALKGQLNDDSTFKQKYCYTRITLVNINAKTFRFVTSTFGVGRNVNLSQNLRAGSYLILVEVYIERGHVLSGSSLSVVSQYPDFHLNIVDELDDDSFENVELEAWRSYVNLNYEDWPDQSQHPQQYSIYLHNHEKSYLQFEAIRNNTSSHEPQYFIYERVYTGGGLTFSKNVVQGGKAYLQPLPQSSDLVLLKHNPLNTAQTDFSISGYLPIIDSTEEIKRKEEKGENRQTKVHTWWVNKLQGLKKRGREEGSNCVLI